MSYDIGVGRDLHNYTYNMSQFFKDFRVHPVNDLDGLGSRAAGKRIDMALVEIIGHDLTELGEKYDAPNGWGDVLTAIRFLSDVRKSCWDAKPGEKVSVS
jgi:hypothetical protein